MTNRERLFTCYPGIKRWPFRPRAGSTLAHPWPTREPCF